MIEVWHTCKECGKDFVSNDNKYRCYCSPECAHEAKRRQMKEAAEREYGRNYDIIGYKPKIIPAKPKPKKSVADICREAAAHKMSYGKYLMYLEGAK